MEPHCWAAKPYVITIFEYLCYSGNPKAIGRHELDQDYFYNTKGLLALRDIKNIEIFPNIIRIHEKKSSYSIDIPHTPNTFKELQEILSGL